MKHFFVGTRTSIKIHNRYNTHFETGMISLLYRVSHPCCLRPDMEHTLKMSKSKLSSIIRMFSTALHKFATPYLNEVTLWLSRVPYYAMLIQQKTEGLMDCIWGFIDGTIRRRARLLYHQRTLYTRFKKCHGVKFQSVTVLEGFIACLQGPWPSKTCDAHMICDSGLIEKLEENMPANGNGVVYAMYSDLAYVQSTYLLGGFRKPPTGSNEALFNRAMSSIQITVEWGIGDVVEKWKFLDFHSAMKIFEMSIAEFYMNGALLSDICNCLDRNKTQQYLGAVQLMLDEYHDLILDETSEETETTADDDDVSMYILSQFNLIFFLMF